ncbi:PilZ domain-containing protein [Oceanimonas pelagia]|uniref:Cyclic diguanosine monophosphate-binding protein n=1 Tax=Oceanimonas pelagia TaxID=3028314 RepID=A0AA50KKT5_9GAMM|nr:PilZ domain-containing protein [Oceanimonas pelagia]WMC09976.1 PilZ domain-containing protein [Oceanimonas pelagia]
MAERRAFCRIDFRADARLTDAAGRQWPARVRDLSLHGALLVVNDWPGQDGDALSLRIPLEDGSAIRMTGRQRHHEGADVGLECAHLDLDSATHLRRLVELNLGDEQLLQRQFEQLLKSG